MPSIAGRTLTFLLAGAFALSMKAASPASPASLSAINLRTEYRTDPIGVDAIEPRMSWALSSPARNQRQTAYQVLVASTPGQLTAARGDLWDSGEILSAQTNQIAYQGRPLASGGQYFWKVRVRGAQGGFSDWSRPATWTMGLLKQSDWQARWIAWRPQQDANDPLPVFRREFSAARPVRRAIAYVSGLGSYELRVNGRKAGDSEIDPGWTNYRKTVLYAAHDVTPLVRRGANTLAVMMGNGMYNVPGGRYAKFKGTFGPPKLILQLELEFVDGSTQRVVSDASWKASAGPIVFSCIYGGEDYDARKEAVGWDKPGFGDSSWQAALETQGPGGILTSQSAPPVKVMQTFRTVRITEPRPGVFVYDLGQNFSGWPRLTVRGPAGAAVRLTTGEVLDDKGLVSQVSSGGPTYFTYTLRGGPAERWRPRFSYTGFRYVQVNGATRDSKESGKPVVLDVEGDFIHSSAAVAGQFQSSNELLNRIHNLVQAAIRSNLQSVLTDCPHREKLGWLEVAHLLGPSILFGYDVSTLYSKITLDTTDSQTPDGLVPDIAPEYTVFTEGFRDSPEWGSAAVILPWLLYQWYGDTRVLERQYDVMRRYADYLGSRAAGHIATHGLGDWYDIGPGRPGESKLTPKGVTATAIYQHDLHIVAETARLLGKTTDAARYAALAEAVKQSFNERFYDTAAGRYATGSQTANAMPLVLDIAQPEARSKALDALVSDIRARGNHTSAGDVGYRYVINALIDAGRSDILFDMATRTDAPSYGAQLKNGATSLTEAWDADPLSSQNHCMLGHIEEWFYKGLAGIQPDPAGVGFNKVVIRPQPAGDVTWVKASYDSIFGPISSHWRIESGTLILDLRVPPNTTATVVLPAKSASDVEESGRPASSAEGVRFLREGDGSATFETGSGEYHFVSPDFRTGNR